MASISRLTTKLNWLGLYCCLCVSAASALHGQARLVAEHRLVFADSVPLSGPTALVPFGEALLLADRSWESVLMVDRSGGLLRSIGRAGEGPGEFGHIWRIGSSGDLVWVVDATNSRISVFDASGAFLYSARADDQAVGVVEFTPLSLLPGVGLTGVAGSLTEPEFGLWWIPVEGREWGQPVPLGRVSARDRMLKVDIPPDGAVNMRWPFSSSDQLLTAPDGQTTVVVRRPVPEGSSAGLLEIAAFETGSVGHEGSISYDPARLEQEDVDAWIDRLSAPRRLAQAGAFPSESAARKAFRDAADPPAFHPPTVSAGSGIEEWGGLIDSENRVWLRRDRATPTSEWWLVDPTLAAEIKVAVPADVRILAATGQVVWGVSYDELGIPTITEYRITSLQGR